MKQERNSRKEIILIINGPNLNLLGIRQTEIYGNYTLDDLEQICKKSASDFNFEIIFKQTNHEGAIIDLIHDYNNYDAIIINAGGYSHSSIAILDALLAVNRPIIEVHLTNIYEREEFRRHSYISLAANEIIVGLGPKGYVKALKLLREKYFINTNY